MIIVALLFACAVNNTSEPANAGGLYPPCANVPDCQAKYHAAVADKNDIFAALYANDACDQGDEDLCLIAAESKDPVWQAGNLDTYCKLYPRKLCVSAGDFKVEHGWYKDAVISYDIGCNAGYLPACDGAAEAGLQAGGDVRIAAIPSATKGCAAGSDASCKSMVPWYIGKPDNAIKLLPGFQAGCTANAMHGCTGVADYYELTATPRDVALAEAFYIQACDGGAARGCSGLAAHFIRLGAQNSPKAFELAKTACDNNDPLGCRLAVGLVIGNDIPNPDFAYGLVAGKRGCELKEAMACDRLAKGIASGKLAGTPEEADAYTKRSCELGYAKACPQ